MSFKQHQSYHCYITKERKQQYKPRNQKMVHVASTSKRSRKNLNYPHSNISLPNHKNVNKKQLKWQVNYKSMASQIIINLAKFSFTKY